MDVENIEALLESIQEEDIARWRKMPVQVLERQGYFRRAEMEGRRVQSVYRLALKDNHLAEVAMETSGYPYLFKRKHYIFRLHHGAPFINPPVVDEEREDLKDIYSALESANH